MAYVRVETPEGVRHVPLERERLTVGRLASNDVVVPHQRVSRYHAEMSRVGDVWWIADMDSTNGVMVGGRRVTRSQVRPGEPVVLAPGVTLTLIVADVAEDPAVLPTTHMPAVGRGSMPDGRAGEHLRATPPVWPPLAQFGPADGNAAGASSAGAPAGPGYVPTEAWVPSEGATAWPGGPDRMRGSEPVQRTALLADGNGPMGPEDDAAEGDLFRRRRSTSHGTATAGPAVAGAAEPSPAVVLHVCQTCGQLTAPDAIHCQSCHRSIAIPCRACGLNLLPIQDRCPRCHTANQASALRLGRRGQPGH
jgi:hypothetical protein